MASSSLTSGMVISVPGIAGETLDINNEFFDTDEFRQVVTYRRFVFGQNPMTGDIDKDNYTDYTIYADVQIVGRDNKLVEAGELEVGDAEIFLPSRIKWDNTKTLIDYEFRPQLYDNIIHRGVTYRIQRLEIPLMGDTESFIKAISKRVSSTQPTTIWNPNYSNTYDVRGGYS